MNQIINSTVDIKSSIDKCEEVNTYVTVWWESWLSKFTSWPELGFATKFYCSRTFQNARRHLLYAMTDVLHEISNLQNVILKPQKQIAMLCYYCFFMVECCLLFSKSLCGTICSNLIVAWQHNTSSANVEELLQPLENYFSNPPSLLFFTD